jgi:outer membrane receptor protein involved in Fe transport
VVQGCYVQQNPAYCSLITRNNSGIYQINSLNSNFGLSKVRGLEMDMTYDTDAAGLKLPVPGSFVFNANATRSFGNTTQNPDGTSNSFVGTFNYGLESIVPVWRGTANIDYHFSDDLLIHFDEQYIGRGKDFDYGASTVAANYISNLSASYDLPAIGPSSSSRIVVGINNLFDKDPPFFPLDSVCKCNSLAGPYDFVGRFFYTRLTTKF